MQEYTLLRRVKGTERAESWTLIVPPSGEVYVEYEHFWDNPVRAGRESENRFHPLSEFLAIGEPAVCTRLLEVLQQLGL